MNHSIKKGTLYLVSTPIGNLEDITIRAVRILSEVDIIAAEDTRKTKILLSHYNINKPLISFFSYNEKKRIPVLIDALKSGKSIAVVSEAGTPGISDPALQIIRKAISENLPVTSIPGPTAFIPALIVSGLPCDEFVFAGFLPQKKGRRSSLEKLSREHRTVILYESPHRLLKTLNEILNLFGNRNVCIGREITKKFEDFIRSDIKGAIEHFKKNGVMGEFVIVIGAR